MNLALSQQERALPRRSAAHWLESAPGEVIAVYDNQGKTADRYSVLLREWYDSDSRLVSCLCLSEMPSHPMGVSQYTSAMRGAHLGRKLRWQDLPMEIQRHVKARLSS